MGGFRVIEVSAEDDGVGREADSRASPPASRASTNFAVRVSRIRSTLVFSVLDVICVIGAYSLAEVVYFRGKAPEHYWQGFSTFLFVAVLITLTANHLFGLYGRMWRHAGAEEARQLVLSASVVVCLLVALYLLRASIRIAHVPLTVIVVGCMFATAAMGLLRFHSRLFAWQRGSRRVGLRVGVVGSRDAGAAAIREMLRSPGAGLVPVAVFDDDSRAHGLSMLGVPVVGSIADIKGAVDRYMLQQVLLAIPDPPPEFVERVLNSCEAANVTMKVLPGVGHLVHGTGQAAAIREAREPRIEDLLGRTPIPIDLLAVRRSLVGRRVLVTGAGGSIGSEICRQVAELDPAELVLLDHDETHLHDAAAALRLPCRQALVDITDRSAVFGAFRRFMPEVVFHAAAHKHVPVLEDHPIEAARTNVFGTINVVEAAIEVGAQRFVQISTDKAVRPSSVMGASKQLAEKVVLSRAPVGFSYCTVRFGNVLGSRGSVIPTFARQIAHSGPVTVTDVRMTRFFMSVEEAVQLVLESSMLSDGGGEVFMLEMGNPVRILDLAERMIRLSGYQVGVDIPIEVIGIRPGEKLDEELNTPDEEIIATSHPYIKRLVPIPASHDELADCLHQLSKAASRRDGDAARMLLFGRAPSDQTATPLPPGSSNGHEVALVTDPGPTAPDPKAGTGRGNGHWPSVSAEQVPA
jgi:FlaA1/EpsC-like NDP-sugar epimerase